MDAKNRRLRFEQLCTQHKAEEELEHKINKSYALALIFTLIGVLSIGPTLVTQAFAEPRLALYGCAFVVVSFTGAACYLGRAFYLKKKGSK